ncbi:hypothetical protein K466DRAFT_156236 [Polyporus arcularius HHB13444]|uniref:Uncharacterized protein n=1 Tax=Polyporus arcularius HHB13444 TaxID=1314778 RepID=A0A5C3PAH9_9APHY|nr:hypothetical protein K466DRAFT_156236 [Polyporus arcularius HHB13444]
MGRVSARPALLSIFLLAVRVSNSQLSASEDERAILAPSRARLVGPSFLHVDRPVNRMPRGDKSSPAACKSLGPGPSLYLYYPSLST